MEKEKIGISIRVGTEKKLGIATFHHKFREKRKSIRSKAGIRYGAKDWVSAGFR
jgi:hypothetical protein